jgi:hypothetical protein
MIKLTRYDRTGGFHMTFNWTGYDPFMILFTILIAWGFVRQLKEPVKDKFAFGFTVVSLGLFLAVDALMVLNWIGQLDAFSAWFFGIFES